MSKKMKPWLWLSFPLAVLVGIASGIGAFDPNAYMLDAPAYAIQGVGQDFATLFTAVPALVISAIFALRGSLRSTLVNLGVLVYLFYSYSMYAITVTFDSLFLVYCLAMGLSFYAIVGLMSTIEKDAIRASILKEPKEKKIRRRMAGLLFFTAAIFYFLWLSDIVPNLIAGTIPESIIEVGLPSNMVHVYDLAILLPALILSGVWLLRKNVYGFVLAPVLILFGLFMTLALVSMVIFMVMDGWTSDFVPAILFSVMAILNGLVSWQFLKPLSK